jgi:hypothetical protein
MDDSTYNNWLKVKTTFEKSGNMNNMYYRRACEIVKTRIDPLANFLEMKNDGTTE